MADRFLIGYTDNSSGYQSNVKPWLLPDNAFQTLENAYVFRGRVRKRFGSIWTGTDQLSSRLRYQVATVSGGGTASGTVPGAIFVPGQQFSIGLDIFTVQTTGTPVTLLATNPSVTVTYNTSTGAFTVAGATPAAVVFFYPATPVMGLYEYFVISSKDYTNIAFDTQFSYKYNTSTQSWIALTAGANTWTGTDNQFFWAINYRGTNLSSNLLWATNDNPVDGIRYFDGTTWFKPILNWFVGSQITTTDGSGNASGTAPGTWFIGQVFTITSGNNTTYFQVTATSGALTVSGTNGGVGTGTFNTSTGDYTFTGAYANAPIFFSALNYVPTSLLIIEFKGRLLLLNTVENVNGVNQNFFNRVRFSSVINPLAPEAFFSGGFVNAPVQEEIVTAQFIKDRLIVYFTESTFEIAYTGNEVAPFTFQKLNTELGAESTFSEIPFDRQVLGVDNIGIHACNGSNVERIDETIPQFSFNFSNDPIERERIIGIRDYYTELVYWSYPNAIRNNSFYFPNRLLVFNYINESWAIFEDSITFMGYFPFQLENSGATWGNTYTAWQDITMLWNSNADSLTTPLVRSVIAGNQQGFVFILRPELNSNASVLQVTNVSGVSSGIITLNIINHNLEFGDFILLSTMNGLTFTDNTNSVVLPTAMATVSVDPFIAGTPNSITVQLLDNGLHAVTIAGTYTGGGTAARVSNINIVTKQYNFYTGVDRNCYVSKIDFLVDKTNIGEVTVNYMISSSQNALVSGGIQNGSLLGTNVLETSPYTLVPFENFQDRLWHPLYFFAEGECTQFSIYMSPPQMFDYVIDSNGMIEYTALQDFQLNAMVIYAQPTSSRMQ